MSNYINKIRVSGTDYTLSATSSGGITSGEVQTMIDESISGFTERFAEDEEVTAAALNDLEDSKQDKLSAGTGISISGNVISATGGGGGNPTVELTQAEYDALVESGTVQTDTYYIITDAPSVDISQYWTSAQTNSAITAAVSGKQDKLSAGTGIDITDNVISATGGGTAYSAGRGIDITNNVISTNLPISAGTGSNSIVEGYNTIASGNYSHAEGYSTRATSHSSHAEGYSTSATSLGSHSEGNGTIANASNSHAEGNATTANGTNSHSEGYATAANGDYSHAEGNSTSATSQSEHASGQFNVSNRANNTWGDSGNTLFSVGNGTANNNRHNAFEIRQNGDIYLTLNGQDVKLQDQLGGGGGGTVDQTIISGSTNAVAGGAVYDKFDEVEQVTAAALNALNDNFDGLKLKKLSQTEYDNLQTKDSNTLYVIVN